MKNMGDYLTDNEAREYYEIFSLFFIRLAADRFLDDLFKC